MTANRVSRNAIILSTSFIYIFFTLFPIYWLTKSAFQNQNELFSFPPKYIPKHPTFNNFINVIERTRLGTLYMNSAIVAILTCLVLMILIIIGSYSMARFNFRGKSIILIVFLISQMIPHVVLLVPFFTFYRDLGIVNTYWSLILTYVFTWLPFSVLMMRSYYSNIPREIDEAALVDGCTRVQALFRVVLPSALPGLVATLIFAFINAWNELIYAVVMIQNPDLQTLPVGLISLMGENRQDWGLVMAIAVMSLIPTIVLFGFIQRYLTAGLTSGAIKG